MMKRIGGSWDRRQDNTVLTGFKSGHNMRIEYIMNIEIPLYIRSAAVLSILGDGFFGFYLNLYVTSPIFDRIQHIFGCYAMALFFYSLILHFIQIPVQPRLVRFILVVGIGFSIGALYEIIEYMADTLLKPQISNQPSLQDTDLDLISDLVGALIAGIHAVVQAIIVNDYS